jgi:hypothetical protein
MLTKGRLRPGRKRQKPGRSRVNKTLQNDLASLSIRLPDSLMERAHLDAVAKFRKIWNS